MNNVKVDNLMLEKTNINIILERKKLNLGGSTRGFADYPMQKDDMDNHEKLINIALITGA